MRSSHELGITALSDSFGPTTLSALRSRFGACIDEPTRHGDVCRIVQSGLYRKGYGNVSTVPLVHIHSAARAGVTTDRLRYSDADIVAVLARCNGTGTEAQIYGRRALGLHRVVEKYNADQRG